MSEELWKPIQDFPNYEISNLGRVLNMRTGRVMRASLTLFGHVKISLIDEHGLRHTRSVAQMVAEAFVEPPDDRSDSVVVLDGNFSNLVAENLVWRPAWFAWKYTRQLKIDHPIYYYNLPVINVITGVRYDSFIDAGMTEGLLFRDISKSTHTEDYRTYPNWSKFEVDRKRV